LSDGTIKWKQKSLAPSPLPESNILRLKQARLAQLWAESAHLPILPHSSKSKKNGVQRDEVNHGKGKGKGQGDDSNGYGDGNEDDGNDKGDYNGYSNGGRNCKNNSDIEDEGEDEDEDKDKGE
ncbi:hypothetical protein C0991_001468, partial [Blastosporella zonata]